MKRNRYRTFWFLFKLTLLLNVYFHHKVTVAASSITKVTNSGEEKFESFLDRKQRPVRLLPLKYLFKNRTENEQNDSRFQDLPSSCEELSKIGYTLNGFYLVKEQTELNKNQIEIVGCKLKPPQGSKEVKEERFGLVNLPAREGAPEIIKRPARLLPLQLLYEKEGNETESKIISEKYFYGPATNCKELSILGYTLNGFYLVKGKDSSKNSKIEIVSCQFKQVSGSKEVKEDRFGFISLEANVVKSNHSNILKGLTKLSETNLVEHKLSRRPVRLIPPKLFFFEEDKIKPENKNQTDLQFNGVATNCKELGILGYTLNGFYLVYGKDKSDTIGIEIVFCRFKLPKVLKKSFNKEERLGFVGMQVIPMDQSSLFDTSTAKIDLANKSTSALTIENIDTTSKIDLFGGVSSHHTSATNTIENSHCNPVGYFKNEDQDICIHSDINTTDSVTRRRCNEVGREQQWAIVNGSHICHPVKDKCFSYRFDSSKQMRMVTLEPYNATSNAQGWQWIEETKQIETRMTFPYFNTKTKRVSLLCLQISTRAFDGFGYPFFEALKCNRNEWSQQWTFIPVILAGNRRKCANFDEREGTLRIVYKEQRLGPVIKYVSVQGGTPTPKSLALQNFGHSTVKETGLPNCSPVGYWKIAERNICLSYDDTVDSGNALVPRLCKGGKEQRWAINGSIICHPMIDKCFTYIIHGFRNDMVALLAYSGRENQQWKRNNDDITQLKIFQQFCLTDADNFLKGSSFIVAAKCNETKETQKWSFIPITDANNRPECASFSGRPSKRAQGLTKYKKKLN